MRTLIIVHLEPDFEHFAGPLGGLVKKVVKYAKNFDRIVNVVSAPMITNTPPYPELEQYRQEEWLWGFDKDAYISEEPERWVEGTNYIATTGHPYSEIMDWMQQLSKTDTYNLVGGCRSECLQDVYEIFLHLGLSVSVTERLTY